MKTRESFLQLLLESGVFRFGEFTTKSGRQSPYFINTGLFRTGRQLDELACHYAELIHREFFRKIDNLYGPAYKGIPLAAAVSLVLSRDYDWNVSYTFNRKEDKDHGEGGKLVGHEYEGNEKVLIIEDVITGGTSVRESCQLLASKKIQPVALVVSVDRMEKTDGESSALQEVREEYSMKTASIIDIEDILALLKNEKILDKFNLPRDAEEKILQYRHLYGVPRGKS